MVSHAFMEIGAGAWAAAYLAIGDEDKAREQLEVAAQRAENHEVDPSFHNIMMIALNVMENPVLEQPEFVAVRNRLTGD